LKQHQAQLERARARAGAADRSKSQFLTNVSHELRSLNRIMGFNHLPNPTKRQRAYSKLIKASSKSLLSLFDDVLDRGTIESGMMEIEALPLKLDACDENAARIPPGGGALENYAGAYMVLVAKDHQINLNLILAVLDFAGCETELAANGQQASVQLDKADFDLIIMDSKMPMLDGLEATKRIRSRSDWKSGIPILSLTADAAEGAEERTLSAGANVYRIKPFEIDSLIAAVKILSQRGRALRQNILAGII
jgi:CheY-like chemotaxis protein